MTEYTKRIAHFIAVVALLACVAALPVEAQNRAAELDSVLTVLHGEGLFTGLLLIGRDGDQVYSRSFGDYASRPLTTHTPIPLASVTKPLTATAALILSDRGNLDLDAPVGRYLENWPYPAVTVRHLLHQTSGLHFLTTVNAHADTSRAVRNTEVLRLIAEHRPEPAFEAGSDFRYDNTNYVVLASVLEAVTGKGYAELMRELVFDPAGMDSARVAPDDEGDAGWLKWLGAGGIIASAEDLLAFDGSMRAGRLLSPEMTRASVTAPALADSSARRYGLGWFLYEKPAHMAGHFGDGLQAKTAFMRELDTGLAYIILMPGDAIHRTDILGAAISVWHGEPYTLPEKRPVADVPAEILSRYVGVYDSGMGRLHITLQNGGLHLEPEGAGGSEPLIPASESVFYFGHQDLTWEFVLDDSGAVTGLMLQGHPQTLGKKIQ